MTRGSGPQSRRRHSDLRSGTRDLFLLYLSLLPVAIPWLRLEQQRHLGVWVLCPLLITALVIGDRRLRRTLSRATRLAAAPAYTLAALVVGLATASLVHPEPFYGLAAWIAVINGLILAATGMTVTAALTDRTDPTSDLIAPAACGAGLTALVFVPVLFAPGELAGLVDALRSGSANNAIASGYRPLFDAIDANPLVVLPEARNTNLRHEPALVLALALAPIGTGRRTLVGRAAKFLAATGLLMTLSRSAIGAGLLVAGVAGVVAVGDYNRSRQVIAPMLASLGALGLLVSPLGASLGDRFQADDRSTVVRSEALAASVDLLGQQPLGTSVDHLPVDFVRPHLFLLDAYLGVGLLGLAIAAVLLGLLVNQVMVAFHQLRARAGGPVAGLVLALGIVAVTRYMTGGSFLHATIAWYGMGAMVGWQAGRSARRARSAAISNSPSPSSQTADWSGVAGSATARQQPAPAR